MEKRLRLSTKKITAIVLASGYSRRFDLVEDKLLAIFQNKPVFQWTLDLLETLPFYEVIIVARRDEILDYGRLKGYQCIENTCAIEGMSASIRLGVNRASQEAEGYMFFTADQPLLKKNVICNLMHAFSEHAQDIIVPISSGQRGNPTLFPRRFKKDLLMLQGDEGGKKIINQYSEDIRFVEIDDRMSLEDIDSKDDLFYFIEQYNLKVGSNE